MPATPPPLEVVLPPYVTPRNTWRVGIHSAVASAVAAQRATFSTEARLAVDLELYMIPGMMSFHDVDNRLKDVLDALQGRVGGTKSKKGLLAAIIPNDRQIFEACVRKVAPAPGKTAGGRLTIRHVDTSGAT